MHVQVEQISNVSALLQFAMEDQVILQEMDGIF